MSLGKTVHELLSEMSSEELAEWIAYDRIEPISANVRAGVIASVVANPKGAKEMMKLLFPPTPKKQPKKKRPGWRALQETLIAMTKAMGGRVVTKP